MRILPCILLLLMAAIGLAMGALPAFTPLPADPDLAAFRSVDNASEALYRGQLLLGNGRYEEALVAYDEVLQADPTFSAAWYLKGYCLHKLGRNEESLAALDQSLRLLPADRDSLLLKATVLDSLGRHTEAEEARLRVPPQGTPVPTTTKPTPEKAPLSGLLVPLAFLAAAGMVHLKNHVL